MDPSSSQSCMNVDPSSSQSHLNLDPSNLHAAECDDEMKGLQNLLDVFGSLCSLQEIAEAYCKAGRDVYKAGDILYQSQESNPNSSLHAGHDVVSKDGGNLCHPQESNPNSSLLECSDEVGSAQSEVLFSLDNHRSVKGSKPRTKSASMGTVSGVLGKTYVGHTSKSETVNDSSGTTKPLKIHVNKSLMDQLEKETVASDSTSRKEPLHGKDMEEFLFSMLVGFELSMDDIREVLGQCGYDAKKSMDSLLVLSAKNLEKDKTKDSDENVPGNPQKESSLFEEDHLSNSQGTSRESSKLGQDRSRLSREVLEALFTAPERSEEEPKRKRPEWGSNRRRGAGRTVVSGPPDTVDSTPLSELLNPREGDINDDEDEYQGLRRTVKLHWDAMKTYYEEALEAFAKGDRVQANYLMEQGHFYSKMAWEVDEKTIGYYNRTTIKEDGESTVENKETRKSAIQADVTLDLHVHTAREAVRMLKFHISSLASIPAFKYLKVIVDSDAEDVTKGKRRRLVNKLLERESITWIEEEENPGTIFIQLDLIDPDELSFTNPLE